MRKRLLNSLRDLLISLGPMIFCAIWLLLAPYQRVFAVDFDSSGQVDSAMPMVAIVFDDAHRSFPYAVDQMSRNRIVGTVYVPTELVGAYDFHATWHDIETAKSAGWEIGDHTATHPNLTKIPLVAAVEEIDRSLNELKQHGIVAESFAAPYGEFNAGIQKIVMERFFVNRMAWGEKVILPENLDVAAVPVFDLSHFGTTYSAMESILRRAIDARGLVVIVFHKIASSDDPAETVDRFTVRRGAFDLFVHEVSKLRDRGVIRCVTVSEGIHGISARSQRK